MCFHPESWVSSVEHYWNPLVAGRFSSFASAMNKLSTQTPRPRQNTRARSCLQSTTYRHCVACGFWKDANVVGFCTQMEASRCFSTYATHTVHSEKRRRERHTPDSPRSCSIAASQCAARLGGLAPCISLGWLKPGGNQGGNKNRGPLRTPSWGKLGPPVVPFCLFSWEGSPTKIDYRKKSVPLF